ncbi:uncharacterized protein [Clytia hemisphaerica]|uniref:uncharacterized protein n=1 Tax=Clytia hemisphaerica TaxID=252671 RepID=UPI0034D6CAEF
MIQEIKSIRYARTIVPDDAANLMIETIDFGDATKEMAAVAIYARILRLNGEYSCQLVFARSKILSSSTQHRAELEAAVLNTHTSEVVKRALKSKHNGSIKLTDSTIVLHWISNDEISLKPFVRNRIIAKSFDTQLVKIGNTSTQQHARRYRNSSLVALRKQSSAPTYEFKSNGRLTDDQLKQAETYFWRKGTEEVKQFVSKEKYKRISTEIDGILTYTGRIMPTDEINVITPMTKVMMDLHQTTFCVPIISKHSPIAYAVLSEVHWHNKVVKHSGIEATLRYASQKAFIIEGREVAKKVKASCKLCRFLEKNRKSKSAWAKHQVVAERLLLLSITHNVTSRWTLPSLFNQATTNVKLSRSGYHSIAASLHQHCQSK